MRIANWLVVTGVGGILLTGGWLSRPDAGACAHAEDTPTASEDAATATPADAGSPRYFDANVAPLLARHCLECHNSTAKKGGLDLSRKKAALAGGESGKAIIPGKPGESPLWLYVTLDEMPKDRPPLSDEEKRHLRRWIEAGATWSGRRIDPSAATRDRRAGAEWIRRLTVPEYIETVRSAVGVDVAEEARRILPPDLRADGFRNTAYNLTVDLQHVQAYAELAEIIVRRMDVGEFVSDYTQNREFNEADLRRAISGMGKRLLRGPLEKREVDAYLEIASAVADEGGTFDEAMGYVIEAMLQSPRFIYRIEGQQEDGGSRRLGNYELASRLSYILWGAPPDEELMRAADAGELSDRRAVREQVRRMLEDPRAVEQSTRFLSQWLHLDRLSNLRPNPERFPDWNPRLAVDMRKETLAFFKHVVWEQNRPLSDLMNAQVTFATPRLADHYGLDRRHAVAGPLQPRPVRIPERVTEGLQILYPFDEERGRTVRDVSGNGQPIHLRVGAGMPIANATDVDWTDAGLTLDSPTLIAADRPPNRLVDAVRATGEITLEAWITPADTEQSGPARILTFSRDPGNRNFTLGQDGDTLDVRLRTTETSGNGIPSLSSPGGSLQARPTHVVYTRSKDGTAEIFIDGERVASGEVDGDFSNWDEGYRLALANELSNDRPWRGTFHLVAVYNRALSMAEVRRNHAAGAGKETSRALAGRNDLQAFYKFDEETGGRVRDTSGNGEPLDLEMADPSAVRRRADGIAVESPTLIATESPPGRLIDAVRASGEITLEVWITPADTEQSGPARILTLSSDPGRRNVTLGQDGDQYDVRLRTTETSANGIPSLSSPGGAVETRPTHLVYTRNKAGDARLYMDGERTAAREIGGDLSNWDDGFRLALANELTGDRPWRGTLHSVAIYSRALTPAEVRSQSQRLLRYDLAPVPARGGLLTQGSVLTVGGDNASTVTRGLFVLHKILDGHVSDPPPCVDTTPVPAKPGLSKRQIAMQRIADSSCGGCHSQFEPFAFGLEKFDGLGAYIEKDEHGNVLRDDGEIRFPGTDEPVAFESSSEMMDLLAGSRRVSKTVTRKVTQFALGRPLLESDAPFVDEIHKTAQANGGTYADLITAVVMSDLVRKGVTVHGIPC